ncbi:hypothetical protein SADUNF_Sadunf05G0014800 [Salix dunnii]|uniref:Uncharacterized protein n=1 Tax=Salix dunnii TaxID=1413687 RepID=A0A835K387_9ROSI|nr:hypothetical protein SADUNF_Sadunf05G0014800 [Salix dunnii]
MARWSSCFLISATILILTVVSLLSNVQGSGDHHLGWIPTTTTTRSSICNKGSIAECMAEDGEEFEMDTEINRRILATSKYISYGALQRNNVPCSRRGASYYNCKRGAQANPYSRGCSRITRMSNIQKIESSIGRKTKSHPPIIHIKLKPFT